MRCKLCTNDGQPLYLNKLYYYCNRCQLIWLDEGDIVSRQDEEQRYLEHNNDLNDAGYVNMFNKFLAEIKPWCIGQRALDFGSGPGPALAHILTKQGWSVDIYDPYFAPDRDFLTKKYDLITCTEVLEHVQHPFAVWKQLTDCLGSRGTLAVMTHFHFGPVEFKDWWYRRDKTHICFYNRFTMEWIAEKLGLALVYCDDFKTTVFTK